MSNGVIINPFSASLGIGIKNIQRTQIVMSGGALTGTMPISSVNTGNTVILPSIAPLRYGACGSIASLKDSTTVQVERDKLTYAQANIFNSGTYITILEFHPGAIKNIYTGRTNISGDTVLGIGSNTITIPSTVNANKTLALCTGVYNSDETPTSTHFSPIVTLFSNTQISVACAKAKTVTYVGWSVIEFN